VRRVHLGDKRFRRREEEEDRERIEGANRKSQRIVSEPKKGRSKEGDENEQVASESDSSLFRRARNTIS